MNQRYRLRILRTYVLSALVLAVIVLATVPAFADATQLFEGLINTPAAHETARTQRASAVEKARNAFAEAAMAGGEKAAPYEYYMAQAYLKLAIEELSSGDKIAVADFAAAAEKYSLAVGQKVKGQLAKMKEQSEKTKEGL